MRNLTLYSAGNALKCMNEYEISSGPLLDFFNFDEGVGISPNIRDREIIDTFSVLFGKNPESRSSIRTLFMDHLSENGKNSVSSELNSRLDTFMKAFANTIEPNRLSVAPDAGRIYWDNYLSSFPLTKEIINKENLLALSQFLLDGETFSYPVFPSVNHSIPVLSFSRVKPDETYEEINSFSVNYRPC